MRRFPRFRFRSRRLAFALLGGVALLVVAAIIVAAVLPPGSSDGGREQAASRASLAASDAGGAVPAPGAPVQSAAGGASSGQSSDLALPDTAQQVIKTGTIGLTVKDLDSGMAQVRAIALQYGGGVLQSNVSRAGDARVGDLTIQVDSKQFDAAMAALRQVNGVVQVTADRTTSQDVTAEYVDVQAQIENLKASATQLRALMDRATSTTDILAIQRELSTVQGQIDRLQARANYLQQHAAMSTIAVHLEPQGLPTAAPGWRFAEVVARAWARSLAVFQGVATVLINVAIFALWLLPFAAVAWLLWRFFRRGGAGQAGTPAGGSPAVGS